MTTIRRRKPRKTNYLNNKDILNEVAKSKISYCEIDDPKYSYPDYIVDNIGSVVKSDDDITIARKTDSELLALFQDPETIKQACEKRASRIQINKYDALVKSGREDHEITSEEFMTSADDIDISDLVFRVLTFEHIPSMSERKKTHRTVADYHVRLNFIPFKHYIIKDGSLIEVGRSHWKHGEFCLTGGSITNELAKMFMLLVKRYAEKSNWRGYSFVDEMKGQALLQLSHMGLRFEESRSQNPFAYFTAVLSNSFTGVLNTEKQNRDLRDNLLESQGHMPSLSRQMEHEEDVIKARENSDFI